MYLKKKVRMKILYYITPHGFGHAVRSTAICNRLNSKIEITFRTTIPESFFREEMKREFNYAPESFDCGCVQKDGVTVDIEKTAETYLTISRENRKKLQSEIKFIQEGKYDLIISDIVPFAFEVAYEADVPSVGISNFNWVDIYKFYENDETLFKPIIKEIKNQYKRANYLFRLMPSNELEGFLCEEFDIPLICGEGVNRRDYLVNIFNIPRNKHLAVIYVGNYGMEGVDWGRLKSFSDWYFLGVYDLPGASDNFIILDKELISYRDLAASVDCVIGKIGYGTTSECTINQTPLLYVPRYDFAEHPILEKYLLDKNLGIECSTEEFQELKIEKMLEKAISISNKKNDISGFKNGVQIAAENLELLLSR